MRNEISVLWKDIGETYEFATDENGDLGGESTAPPPLSLIVAGLAGCLMTNIRLFARKKRVDLRGLKVTVEARWIREVTGTEPHVANTDGFSLDVEMDCPQGTEAQIELLRAASKGCFVEHSLINPVALSHRLKTAGGWIDV
jgi:uncharacterized OsmC-like protein